MAEELQNQYDLQPVEEEEELLPPDRLGSLVRELYDQAAQHRQPYEDIWRKAWHAYRGEFEETDQSDAEYLAKVRRIYVNLTRRKVNEARVKLVNSILENGKIPFSVSPSRRPRFMSPDMAQAQDPYQEAQNRAFSMEQKIRDVLEINDYESTLVRTINEQTLYGTGATKSVVLKQIDFPVYRTANQNPYLLMAEEAAESELVPHVEWVSVWDVFPSPGARYASDMDYVVHRSYLSAQDLREMANRSAGQIPIELVEACIAQGEGLTEGSFNNDSPSRDSAEGRKTKKYQVLELWHRGLGREDLEEFIHDSSFDSATTMNIPVCITTLGTKVLRAMPNPFEGRLPFDFCYWQESEDSIWGSGIYDAIRDDQTMINFVYAMFVEGKTMATQPMVAINPNAFDATQDDFAEIYPGKIWRLKAGESVNDAFKPVIIPDVTNGLADLIKIIERNTDLSSGQVPIGMGSNSSYQTRTATGMSILDQNSQKLTMSVVRSVNHMIRSNIQSIYHWLLADSQDPFILGDFECRAHSYRMFMAREINNQQILEFLQVVGQNPEMRQYVNFGKLVHPLKMGLGLDVDGLLKTDDEVGQMNQMNQQQEMEFEKEKAQIEIDKGEKLALVEEMKGIAADTRKAIIQERLAKIKEGSDTNLENGQEISQAMKETSLILELENMKARDKAIQQISQQQAAANPAPNSDFGDAFQPQDGFAVSEAGGAV